MAEENKKTDKKIIIVLDDSTYPHAFKDNARIHQQEFKRAIKLIDEQYYEYKEYNILDDNVLRNRFHNTISVFGGRGTGKTSFLHSVLNYYKKDSPSCKGIEVLGIIDPTTLEEKGHPFLYIISLINECVIGFLNRKESAQDSNTILQKKQWKNDLLKLAKGLPSLDSLGPDYRNNNWQDNDFIMEKGLEQVSCALNLETFFHRLVEQALKIIGKNFFMLAFDDIDLNIKKGWPILECIRKYLTTPKIITLLSGNLKFYSNNIRIQQWKQFATLVKFEANGGADKEMMNKLTSQVTEVEGQYLLKIFKAENRVHLHSIYDAINTYKWDYYIKYSERGTKTQLKEKYVEILRTQNIRNEVSIDMFVHYFMSLSVRTQINFLRNNKDIDDVRNFKMVDPFLSRMHASNIDVDFIINNPRMSIVVSLGYLLRYNILQESYLLLPTNDDENVNGCVTGITFILNDKFIVDPSIMFDYMLRIGYIRNIMLSVNEVDTIKKMCRYAGAYKDISLKNFIGLTMAYLFSYKLSNLREHAAIYGLASTLKNTDDKKRIDEVLQNDVNPAQRCISLLPLCALKSINSNGSNLYYSVFLLLGAICQVIKSSSSPVRIINELQSLQILRYYPTNNENTEPTEAVEKKDLSENVTDDVNDKHLENLANALYDWVNSYHKTEIGRRAKGLKDGRDRISLPPYALGRITTRLFSVSSHIRGEKLGEMMHHYLITLLNACLIDEAREIMREDEDKNSSSNPQKTTYQLLKLNFSNAVNSDKIFKDNLKIVKDFGWDYFKFTKWLAKCPLIYAFLNIESDKDLSDWYSMINPTSEDFKDFSVYNILKNVDIKK